MVGHPCSTPFHEKKELVIPNPCCSSKKSWGGIVGTKRAGHLTKLWLRQQVVLDALDPRFHSTFSGSLTTKLPCELPLPVWTQVDIEDEVLTILNYEEDLHLAHFQKENVCGG